MVFLLKYNKIMLIFVKMAVRLQGFPNLCRIYTYWLLGIIRSAVIRLETIPDSPTYTGR
jgi:hypothetical protein